MAEEEEESGGFRDFSARFASLPVKSGIPESAAGKDLAVYG